MRWNHLYNKNDNLITNDMNQMTILQKSDQNLDQIISNMDTTMITDSGDLDAEQLEMNRMKARKSKKERC